MSAPETFDAKSRILAVAAEEFAQKGFEGASTAGIARLAGVTQPLIHYYFKSKDRLWQAMVDLLVDQLGVIDQATMDELCDLDPISQIKVLTRRLVHVTRRSPHFARLLLQEGSTGGPRFEYLNRRVVRPLVETLQATLERGQQEGWIKPLPIEHLLMVWLSASTQLFAAPALAEEILGADSRALATSRDFADTYVEMLVNGLVNPVACPPSPMTINEPSPGDSPG